VPAQIVQIITSDIITVISLWYQWSGANVSIHSTYNPVW